MKDKNIHPLKYSEADFHVEIIHMSCKIYTGNGSFDGVA